MINKQLKGPADFDLTKYAALEDFEPMKWAQLIKSRQILRSLLEISDKAYFGTASDDSQKMALREVFDGIENTSLADTIKGTLNISGLDEDVSYKNLYKNMFDVQIERFFDNPLTPLDSATSSVATSAGFCIPAVRPICAKSILDLNRALLEVNEKFPDRLSKLERNPYIAHWEDGNYDSPVDEVIKDSTIYNIRHIANFAVDLSRSDDSIREDFNKLLATYRKVSDFKPPPITPVTLKRWCDNLILPYADLMLWSQWTKTALKAKDFENLLFPGKVANDVLKGTKNAFKEAFSSSTVSALLRDFK